MFSDPEFRDQLEALFQARNTEQAAIDEVSRLAARRAEDQPSSWETLERVVHEALKPSEDLPVSPRLKRVFDEWETCLARIRDLKVQERLAEIRTALLDWNEEDANASDELNALERQLEACLLGPAAGGTPSLPQPGGPSQSLEQRQRAIVCLLGQVRAAARASQSGVVQSKARAAAQAALSRTWAAGEPEMRTLAVMFTDMAGSTEYAESSGSRAAYDKRVQHNNLLLPLIESHSGTLVQIIGDALLAIFDEAADAARCAIAMQRRLAEYNRSGAVDVESLEIHIRVGIHYGKAIVFQEHGHVELAGRAVNMAARVESGGGKDMDQILISEAALAELLPFEEFATEPAAVVQAKGIAGPIQLHRLHWQDSKVRLAQENQVGRTAEPSMTLSAATAKRLTDAAYDDSNSRACHCLFVDPRSGRGYIVPVWVKIAPGGAAGIRCAINCDRVMQAASERAIRSAFDVLPAFGFKDARIDAQGIEWWIDAPNIRFEGASLGLALMLATVAAYTGTEIDPETAVTGAVDKVHVVPVEGLGSKWLAIRNSGRFKKLVLPSANLEDLPTDARRDTNLQVIDVPDVESAVIDVLGPALGMATRRLAAATTRSVPTTEGETINVRLWVQPEARSATARNISIVPKPEVHNWFVGQSVRFCAQVDHDCHLSLINIGATGHVTILIPNSLHPETFVRAHELIVFPAADDGFLMHLNGPPGRERVIAIASDRPLRLRPEDFDQSGKIVCARPTTRSIMIVAEDLSKYELARGEIEFYVSERNTPTVPGASVKFQPLELG